MSLNGYKTVLREARDEVVIHKSRFIGHAAPVSSTEEALRFLARIREEHRDATHNCYAYIIGPERGYHALQRRRRTPPAPPACPSSRS